jgi:hypothetical protein
LESAQSVLSFKKRMNYIFGLLVILLSNVGFTSAFTIPTNTGVSFTSTLSSSTYKSPKTELNLIGGLFGKKETEQPDPNVPTRVFDIPLSSLKLGGTRFALGLFLIGQQGTPVKGSWKVNPVSDQVLDMYYVDDSAMFSLNLDEKSISIDRYGSPSLQYLLQESLVLHRLLDEIHTIALGNEEVEETDRLIVFADERTAIENARSKLSARPAE